MNLGSFFAFFFVLHCALSPQGYHHAVLSFFFVFCFRHLSSLIELGVSVIPPASKLLACGDKGALIGSKYLEKLSVLHPCRPIYLAPLFASYFVLSFSVADSFNKDTIDRQGTPFSNSCSVTT